MAIEKFGADLTPKALLEAIPAVKPFAQRVLIENKRNPGHYKVDKYCLDEMCESNWNALFAFRDSFSTPVNP